MSNIELRVPWELDFIEFIDWVKQTHKERILRYQFNPPYSYSRKNHIITSYFHTSDDSLTDKLIENITHALKLVPLSQALEFESQIH